MADRKTMKRLRKLEIPLRERSFPELLARKAAENGDKPYLLFEGRRFSYRDADEITTRIANALQRLGIGRGDHVASLSDNRPELLWLYFALAKLGAVSVPVNTAAKGELLAYYLNHSDAVAICLEAPFVERFAAVQDACPALRQAVVLDGELLTGGLPLRLPSTDYRLLEQGANRLPVGEVRFSDTFCFLYTSGTTGPSKASISSHCHAISYAVTRIEALGYRPDDVLYTCLPLFHGNALYGACIPALVADATVAVSRRFSARAFWEEVRASGATKFNLLGAMVNILWSQPESPRDTAHQARQCTMVPVPEFAAAFEKRFNIKITSVYALTDYGLATILPPDHPPEKLRSAGRPVSNVEVAILDDDDMPLPAGETGEICMRAKLPWISAQGYYKMPEETLEARRNLWFHTGDRGYLDSDGYLYFVDRKKDAIRRRGENISSWEVEQIILQHPAVAEVAAYAVQSEMSEDEVMVTVVCRPGESLEPAALVRFCQENMAYFMVPRFVEIADTLPKTETQKVLKAVLQARAQERIGEVWDREKAGIRVHR